MSRTREILSPLSRQWEALAQRMVDALLNAPRDFRRALVVVVHLGLAVLSSYVAFSLRFDGQIPPRVLRMFLATIPWLLVARGSTFFFFRLDEGIWRYVGLWDLRRIAAAIVSGSFLFYVLVRWGYGTDDYPRSIFLIDSAILLILMGSFRLSPRLYRELVRAKGERRLLIVGAGDTGERVLRQMQQDPTSVYDPLGFIDDDQGKVGQRMHGVRVLGGIGDLPELIKKLAPQEVMVAIPRARPDLIRELVTMLAPYKVPITTVVLKNGLAGNSASAIPEIRSLSVEDLLSRPPVGLGMDRIQELVTGKRVVVTGAGGSIGSELSRQIAALRPDALVLYERYENGLYEVGTALHDNAMGAFVHPVVGDVTDEARLNAVFSQFRPDIVFHAAAHKHVPLMEFNPCEAVKNNVTGTRLVAEAALRHGVERFVLISTDKAVNPSSVMGASKRVAELVTRMMARWGKTRFVSVRFGNVLGSNGSVLLRFQEQIRTGGPVTVTDPDITRFFMLIPEAVELVLHAAAVGRGGDTLVLDMGAQLRVADLARNLIRLSGRLPEEVPIVYTGLRPGEKLFEELAGEGEQIEPCTVEKILRIASGASLPSDLEAQLCELERLAVDGDVAGVTLQLSRLVPTFRRNEIVQPV